MCWSSWLAVIEGDDEMLLVVVMMVMEKGEKRETFRVGRRGCGEAARLPPVAEGEGTMDVIHGRNSRHRARRDSNTMQRRRAASQNQFNAYVRDVAQFYRAILAIVLMGAVRSVS